MCASGGGGEEVWRILTAFKRGEMDVCNKFDEDIHEATERNEASTTCDTFIDDIFFT